MLQRAYNALIAAGIDARLATLHTGVCDAPYCVIYEGMDEPGKSVCIRHLMVDILVPASKPVMLPQMIESIREVMQQANFPAGTTGQTSVLEDYKAITVTIDFAALCGL